MQKIKHNVMNMNMLNKSRKEKKLYRKFVPQIPGLLSPYLKESYSLLDIFLMHHYNVALDSS